MNKDFTQGKLLSMDESKQIRVLYQLASFIEENKEDASSSHFAKLKKYHSFLTNCSSDKIQILNKEFHKVEAIDYQFQVYLMNLERLLGQSKKEYQFLVPTGDEETKKDIDKSIICVLDSVRSAHNVGAMFRNAECFGAEEMILTGLSPKADHPQVIKTAMGTVEKLKWSYQKSIVEVIARLQDLGYEICCVEKTNNSISIDDFSSTSKKIALIFGHEQFGVSQEVLELSDKVISINLFGVKNSLNVSVAQGIVLQKVAVTKATK